MNDETATKLATSLDRRMGAFLGARARVLASCRDLLLAALALATEADQVRGMVHGNFAKWCRVHCRVFQPKTGQTCCAMVGRVAGGSEVRIETWWLRALGVISAIHHAARPKPLKDNKVVTWVGSVGAVKDKMAKAIDQAGGVEKLDPDVRDAMVRHLGTLENIKRKLQTEHAE